MQPGRAEDRLQASIAEINRVLARHRLLETLTHRQESSRRDLLESLQRRQNLVELEQRCKTLHPADLAALIELLPIDDRMLVWTHSPATLRAEALVEMSDTVRWGLVESIEPEQLADCLRHLEADDIAYLEGRIPSTVWSLASRGLDVSDQTFLREVVAYPEDSIGHLMSRQVATLNERATVLEALADLRKQGELPPLTDRLFVLDSRHVLRGVVPLGALIQAEASRPLSELMGKLEIWGQPPNSRE